MGSLSVQPPLMILQECATLAEANDAERMWIATFAEEGFALLNINPGGCKRVESTHKR
jgi:hypothetical protein